MPAWPGAGAATRTGAGRDGHRRSPSHGDTTGSRGLAYVRPLISRPPPRGPAQDAAPGSRRGCAEVTGPWRSGPHRRRSDPEACCTPIPRPWRDPTPPFPRRTNPTRRPRRVARGAPLLRRAATTTPAFPAQELPGRPSATGRRPVRRERSALRKSESTPGAPLPIIGSARTAHRKTQTSRRSRRSPRDGDRRVIADDRARIGTGRGVTTRDTPRRRP